MNNYYFLLIVVALIFGYIAWLVYKDIKEAAGEKRQKKILVYAGIFVACLLVYFSLRIFAKEPLSDLYYWLGGTVDYFPN